MSLFGVPFLAAWTRQFRHPKTPSIVKCRSEDEYALVQVDARHLTPSEKGLAYRVSHCGTIISVVAIRIIYFTDSTLNKTLSTFTQVQGPSLLLVLVTRVLVTRILVTRVLVATVLVTELLVIVVIL